MNMDLGNEKSLKSYLLGDLNPDEQQRLEQHLMTDSDAFEQLALIEDELIDEYLEGSLSRLEKNRFETFFLAAPERRQKLSFAKSLKRYVAANRPKAGHGSARQNSWKAFWHHQNQTLKWALAASLMLLIGGGSWSAVQISRLQNALQLAQSPIESRLIELEERNLKLSQALQTEQDRNSLLKEEVANLQLAQKADPSLSSGPIHSIVALATLVPGRIRSSDSGQSINVPSGAGLVQLNLQMEPLEYPQYQILLQRVDEDQVTTQRQTLIKGQFSGLSVSAELLTSGDYELKLSGIAAAGDIEVIGTYYFEVNKQ